jgi:two-component system, LytTR family, response regulator
VIRVAIIEDERPAREHLDRAVRRAEASAEVVAQLDSVAAAVDWLRSNPAPDLVLADIQLSDGLALDIFEAVDVGCPVVFCTAYDEYLTEAMRHNGIDYLLKPIRDRDVADALDKYRRLGEHFGARLRAFAGAMRSAAEPARQRLLVRSGEDDFVAVPLSRIAYFEVEDKLVALVTVDGARYAVDRPLSELEAELSPSDFFRLNRQYLVQARAVERFRPYFKGRLVVDLVPAARVEVVVSQENAARFRAWMDR